MMRIHRKIAAVLAVTALAGAAGGGVAQASSGTPGDSAPSACRPANHLAKITDGGNSAGHHHYRVTLTAPKGYAPCELAGAPTDVRFSHDGKDVGVTPERRGGKGETVTFGPGHPVHFDIQVRNGGRGVPADEASFTLRAPDGEIPGTSVADGKFKVTSGTQVGPVRPGA
ncbi:DUF4232 domain-containing protein [Streptomyces sp. NPDC048172]|uniref:DUF4232 domain-containing protein n=1 Tax=Streptomyces sp. NPDC048172 TaxID=3365505 RepID=UPI00371CF651